MLTGPRSRDRIQFHRASCLERLFGRQLFQCCLNAFILSWRYPCHQLVAFSGRHKRHVGECRCQQCSCIRASDGCHVVEFQVPLDVSGIGFQLLQCRCDGCMIIRRGDHAVAIGIRPEM